MATSCTSDRCQQGRAKCPCPEACELPIQYADEEPEEPTPTAFAVVLWICCCIAVLALVSFIAGLSAGFN